MRPTLERLIFILKGLDVCQVRRLDAFILRRLILPVFLNSLDLVLGIQFPLHILFVVSM